MSIVSGLCGENHILVNGSDSVYCQKTDITLHFFRTCDPTEICRGCRFACKSNNEKQKEKKPMKIKGLCGEENIVVNGCCNYICHKAGFGLVSKSAKPTDLCLECDFAKCNNQEQPENKIEDSDKTVSKLCDMIAQLHTELYHAKNDIGAFLFLNGNCEYCANGQVEKYCGAERWTCKLCNGIDCKPVWRGIVKESEEE